MTKVYREPSRYRGKTLITLFTAAVAALTGGAQALGPALAAAETSEGTVACFESSWFNECEDGSGVGGVGGSSSGGASGGDGVSDYSPWEDDSGSTAGGGAGEATSVDPDYGGNGYDVPATDPKNPPSSTQVEWKEPIWVPWTDSARDHGWSQRHLQYLYGRCESIQDDVEDIRDDLREGKSGGRWWTVQSREKRVKALHKSWAKLGCAGLFDMVEG